MFYSHEVLTNRKYGVATIWLVATLGSKSSLKKVTRRAILDVNLPRACESITEPEAPLALPLQGSLLYGVSRVYSQQCGYVLADVTSLRDKMRGSEIALKRTNLDPDAGTARPDQLNLADDPAFIPDLDIGFDLSAFGFSTNESSASDVLSGVGNVSSQSSIDVEEEEDCLDAAIQSYDTPGDGIDLFGISAGAGTSSVGGTMSKAGAMPSIFDDEPGISDDLIFDVDENGVLRPIDDITLQTEQPAMAATSTDEIEAAFNDILASEHLIAASMDVPTEQLAGLENDMPIAGGDEAVLDTTEDALIYQDGDEDVAPEKPPSSSVRASEEASVTAEAPQRRIRANKVIKPDRRTELSNKDLKEWNDNYLSNMQAASRLQQQQVSYREARRYAELWTLGQGLGRVAFAFGHDKRSHPLAIFSGDSLWDMLRGPMRSSGGSKRSHSQSEEGDLSEQEERRVRARSSSREGIAPVVEDDGMMIQDDFNLENEVGRHAPPSLQDHSSGMPWNLSASRQSSAPPLGSGFMARLSSSVGGIPGGMELGPGSALGRVSRQTSASPLLAKGLPRLGGHESPEPSRLTSNEGDYADLDEQLGAGIDDDFELYGPSATVDTQTAQQNEWVAAALENEAFNFLAFMQTKIAEDAEEGENETIPRDGTPANNSITFSQLLPPEANSYIVGAQGLLHVLALATKGLIQVNQNEAFGEIEMSIRT